MSDRTIAALRCLALALGLVLALAAVAHAEPQPLTKEEQTKIDEAIDKAVSYIKGMQKPKGNWEPLIQYGHPMTFGATALPALALLEAGVAPADPVVQKAAAWMRPLRTKLDHTYDVSLALLFFDRLGEAQDKSAIRSLALRLIAGQCIDGGWGYRCPTLSSRNEEALLGLLRQWEEDSSDKTLADVQSPFNALTVFQDASQLPWLDSPMRERWRPPVPRMMNQATDNSNTQFAILALWAARRHDMPVRRTLRLVVRRFESSQAPDGKWSYNYHIGPCQTLVAAAYPKADPRFVALVRAVEQSAMTTVGPLGLAMREGVSTEKAAAAAVPDIQVLRGFAAVSRIIGEPTGQMKQQVPMTAEQDLYYLWSLERLAMLYDLPTIGGKDWYRWGAEVLVTNQMRRGCWGQWDDTPGVPGYHLIYQNYGGTINTSFALMFLKRSHLLRDLTAKLPCKADVLEKRIAATLQGGRLPGVPAATEPTSKKP
jgi:hypothetical protein